MNKLNHQSTAVFCRVLSKLGKQTHIRLTAPGFMDLVVEKTSEGIVTPWGNAALYSLAHYYQQNGDAMRDPEMVFIVVDNRKEKKQTELIGIYPQMYQQDALGLYEESIQLEDGKVTGYIKKWQESHCSFANMWLKNIAAQGFLQ